VIFDLVVELSSFIHSFTFLNKKTDDIRNVAVLIHTPASVHWSNKLLTVLTDTSNSGYKG